MRLPPQNLPINRFYLYQPHDVVNAQIGYGSPEAQLNIRIDLLHGANHNDPAKYYASDGFCGCHILSKSSISMCLATCRVF